MANKKQITKNKVDTLDILAFLSAIMYMQSVLTVAHHTSMWVHDGSSQVVGPPAVPALVIGLLLTGYSLYKKSFAYSTLTIITITIFITSSIFWLSALRTNFYF